MAEYTPMMRQYFEIKEQYKDAILMYRLGDFYEMFFDDALTASRVLEITLTGRDCGQEERAPMCGVPFHAVDSYIAKLVENGYAVVAVSHAGSQSLEVSGSIRPRWMAANSNVRADLGRLALVYGPYVYCLEETDNGKLLSNVFVSADTPVEVGKALETLPGALPSLHFAAKRLESGVGDKLYGEPSFSFTDHSFTAVPYALWCNREPGEMLVWLKAII